MAKIIVLEGVDNTGKTTLAEQISIRYGLPVQHSGGPCKYPGEINKRLSHFLDMTRVVFDRHVAISQPLYGSIKEPSEEMPSDDLVRRFYRSYPFIIYCDPISEPDFDRVSSSVETPEHRAMVAKNYNKLLASYRTWAAQRAHVIYRIGDYQGAVQAALQQFMID